MKPELLRTTPESWQFWLVFVDMFAEAGLDSSTVVTLDTVADESRKKMADGMTRAPARLVAETGICHYGRLVSTHDFLAFVPCFLLEYFSYFLLPYSSEASF